MQWPSGPQLRLSVVVALLCAGVVGVVVAQPGNEDEYQFEGANCYGCHKPGAGAYNPPLVSMYRLLPQETVVTVGTEFDYGIEVEQTWLSAQIPWPKLMRFEGNLDLSGAPSLGFTSEVSPLLGVQRYATIVPKQDDLGMQPKARVPLEIPVGVSDLVITLAPNSTDPFLGPDVVLNVYPKRWDSTNAPNFTVDDGGAGEAEKLVVHGNGNISRFLQRIWGVEGALKPVVDRNPDFYAERREVPFTVTMDAYFNSTGEARKFVIIERVVEAGQRTIVPFRLVALREPVIDEPVKAIINVTALYLHDGHPQDDWANFTKSYSVRLSSRDSKLVLGPPQDATLLTQLVEPPAVLPLPQISEAVGYLSGFLLIASIASGGMFGAASRRSFNRLFGTARRRVAFHNVLSYFLTLAAAIHTILFIIEKNYEWTLGIIWGGIAILAMLGLGVTGALQVLIVRRWSYGWWKWTHYGLAVAAIVFTLVHMGLDGVHFVPIQEAVGWKSPFPDNAGVAPAPT